MRTTTENLSVADGRQLAVDMFRELQQWAEQIETREVAKISDGENESDMREVLLNEDPEILRRYLSSVSGNAALEHGFLCMLSHFICRNAVDSEMDGLDEYVEQRPGLRFN